MNPPREHFAADVHAKAAPWPPLSDEEIALRRAIRAHNEKMSPGYLAAGGHTQENLCEPDLSLAEAVEQGMFSPAEYRQIQGIATAEDLAELGYDASEASEILETQRVRACASST